MAEMAKQPQPSNAKPFLRIVNAAGRASIHLLDAVSPWTPANAKAFQADLHAITAPAIDLYINSPGGSVFEGLAIYNMLKAHKAKVTVHVIGLAASIASVIAMAGDEIIVNEGAMMMIHSPWLSTGGNAEQLRKDAALLDAIEESILDVYQSRTGRPRAEIQAEVKAETWFGAKEAVKAKFATRTGPASKVTAFWNPANFPNLPGAALMAAQVVQPITTPPAIMSKTISLADFRKLDATTRTEFCRNGGEILPDAPQHLRRFDASLLTKPAAAATAAPAPPPTKFAKLADAEVIGTLKDFMASKPDRETAAVEMEARGFEVDRTEHRAFIYRTDFDAMSERDKNAAMRSGFSLKAGSKPMSPTEIAKSKELTFPTASGNSKKPRTAAQLWALSPTEVKEATAEAGDEKEGREIRQLRAILLLIENSEHYKASEGLCAHFDKLDEATRRELEGV